MVYYSDLSFTFIAVAKAYAIASELVGFVSGVMGLYDGIAAKVKKDEHGEIMNGFNQVKEKLSDIEKKIEETTQVVREEGIMTRYLPCESVVKNSLRSLNNYLHDGKTQYLKETFLHDAKDLKKNIDTLISGLLASGLNSGDVLITAKRKVKVVILIS